MTGDGPAPAERIIADALALAEECGWSTAIAFAAGLPAPDDRAVRLFAAAGGCGAELLRGRLAERPGAPRIDVTPLEDIVADTGLALRPNRALAVLRCGELLTPEAVEAAAAVVRRASGSGLVVLTHAEILNGPDDLDLVQRGVWRTLFTDAPLSWAGQDLAEHGVLLWADSSAEPAAFLTPQLARDAGRFTAWLDGPGTAGAELRLARAAHMLDLMERAADAAEHRQPGGETRTAERRLTRLRTQTADLRRRWLKRLDEDRATLARQLEASLEVLEQELLSALREVPQRQDRHRPVPARLDQELLGWAESTRELTARRVAEDHGDLGRLADELDWELVDDVTEGEAPFREALLSGGRALFDFAGIDSAVPSGRDRPVQVRRSAWPSRAAVGAVIGAGAGMLASDDGILTLALGTAGAASGAASAYFSDQETARRAAGEARRDVVRRVGEIRTAVRERLRGAAEEARAEAAATFDSLDRQLAAAVARTERQSAGTTPGTALAPPRQRLDELRDRLRAATGK
ncbi:hypothetical protein ACFRIC_01275 [Streptomyces sp. NPDC056738]|uniref:hypothetical protein n=1 Tax=Streptomyces sp. NPDC056738 TaxID=3345933 RepID=UPI00369A0C85